MSFIFIYVSVYSLDMHVNWNVCVKSVKNWRNFDRKTLVKRGDDYKELIRLKSCFLLRIWIPDTFQKFNPDSKHVDYLLFLYFRKWKQQYCSSCIRPIIKFPSKTEKPNIFSLHNQTIILLIFLMIVTR